jgi:diguanylate cyclase (GGDEF)-like protein
LADTLNDGPGMVMSFRTRLTSFFLLIVVVPMVAVGFLVFRLIGDSEQGKADARASGLATAASSVYTAASDAARSDAQTIARDVSLLGAAAIRARVPQIASQVGLARVSLRIGPRTVVDVGDHTAMAPGIASVVPSGSPPITVAVSELTAAHYTHELAAPGVAVVVSQGPKILSSTIRAAQGLSLPSRGTVTVGGTKYRSVTQSFAGFGGPPVRVTVLSDLSATATSVTTSRIVAAVFIAGFLLLAFSFSVLASRALAGQLGRFLQAARRLAGGDFSSHVPIDGRDEFAALGEEFNSMSSQLARRIDELRQERVRLRESVHRIGQTFASNLDRPALLDLALRTAVDAVNADCGRVSVRSSDDGPLAEMVRVGSLADLEDQIYKAERAALSDSGFGESDSEMISVASIALGPIENGGRAHGLITVGRQGRSLTDDDRELLRSLGTQATLALENVELHFQVRRQAVTDELTGLANHGRFQEMLTAEIDQVRRYQHQVGLIMLDIDDFKSINDTYGHQQGDVVLRQVGRIVRESSRDADLPARYGGEEMALILPHTDLEGSYAIAERVRTAIEALHIPRLDHEGTLRITASFGVTASAAGNKDALIADADGALYTAKRQGKNRTVRAAARTANLSPGE